MVAPRPRFSMLRIKYGVENTGGRVLSLKLFVRCRLDAVHMRSG